MRGCLFALAAAVWLCAEQAPQPAPAQSEPLPELSADQPIEFDQNTQELIARENAELVTPQFTVKADKLSYNRQTQVADAQGNVRLAYHAARILTRRAQYDVQQKQIRAEDMRAGIGRLYIKGQTVDGNAEAIAVNNATLYFVEPDPYAINLAAEKLTVLSEPYRVRIDSATLRLGPVPVFWLPSYTQGLNDRPPLRVKLNAGSRKSLGFFGETSVWWTKDPVWAPGVMFDYYEKRGPMYGPMLEYDYRKKGWEQYGDFRAAFIRDQGTDGEYDLLDNPIDKSRYYFQWFHKGHLTERVDVTSVLNWWSDSHVTRDFRKDYWDENQTPDNFMEIVYKGDFFYADAFARYQVNDFYGVQQRLPELRFDMVPVQIGKSGLYQQGQAGYVHLQQRDFSGAPALEDLFSNRYDLYYGLSYPYSPNGWSTITPVLGGRMTHYAHTVNGSDDFTRLLGQIGFDAEMRMHGQWDFNQKTWGINGLRHVFKPIAQYRYIPAADQGSGRIPHIDNYVFESFPPILDLGHMRNLDDMREINTMRIGVENSLQTRGDNGRAARDLLYLNLYQDFNFTKDPEFGTYSDTYIMGGLSPARWLQLDVLTRFDSEDLTLRETRARIRFKSADKWFVDFNADYGQNEYEQYYIDAFYRINERFGLHGRWRYDTYYGGFTEQTYGLSQRWGNSWRVRYELSYRRGTEDYKGVSFNIRIDVLGF